MDASLTRIIIFGQAINQLKTFYVKHFNLKVIEEVAHEWVVLVAGPVEIGLHRIGEAYTATPGVPFKANSNTKLVFNVKADLPILRQNLIDQGVLMKELKSFPGIKALFCDGEDPEGNVFQLEQRQG